MGLLDDLMGPLRDLASVKDEVTQTFSEVKDSLVEAKDQVVGEVSGLGDSVKEAVQPLAEPLEGATGENEEKK